MFGFAARTSAHVVTLPCPDGACTRTVALYLSIVPNPVRLSSYDCAAPEGRYMPRADTCLLNDAPTMVDAALKLRDEAKLRRQPAPDFRCMHCNMPVRPHRDGSHGAAHFEHHRRNPQCDLSDPARP